MNSDRTTWHEAFRILREDVSKFQFHYPAWFEYLAEQIPATNSRARRDVPRFLSLLEAIALCQSFSDGRREKSKGIEIVFADYCAAYAILCEAFTSTYVGAHPRALEFAKAVRVLCAQSAMPVTTKDVAAHLHWKPSVAHKWRVEALRRKLVQYKIGTYPANKKPLLPGPARQATGFLPDPHLVFRERPHVGSVVRYIDPITDEKRILRRPKTDGDSD